MNTSTQGHGIERSDTMKLFIILIPALLYSSAFADENEKGGGNLNKLIADSESILFVKVEDDVPRAAISAKCEVIAVLKGERFTPNNVSPRFAGALVMLSYSKGNRFVPNKTSKIRLRKGVYVVGIPFRDEKKVLRVKFVPLPDEVQAKLKAYGRKSEK